MRMCKLRDGSLVRAKIVQRIYAKIEFLYHEKAPKHSLDCFISLYDLGKKARDFDHKFVSNKSVAILANLDLIDKNGYPNSFVQHIAKSAIEFYEDIVPILKNPVLEVVGGDSNL